MRAARWVLGALACLTGRWAECLGVFLVLEALVALFELLFPSLD